MERDMNQIPLGELITPKISDVPSIAIRQALDDLEKAEACDNLYVNMNVWHGPFDTFSNMAKAHMEQLRDMSGKPNATCVVCLAGSVISAAGNDARRDIRPENFDHTTYNKLLGFNALRTGDVPTFLKYFGFRNIFKYPRMFLFYENDPVKFKQELRKLADCLEKDGL